jgi:hypothetical protein
MIRRPADGHAARDPHRAVVRTVAPAAVGVQIGVSRHVARDIACGPRHVFAAVAILAEKIEGIGSRSHAAVEDGIRAFESSDANLFAGVNRESLAVRGRLAVAGAYSNDGRVALLSDFDAILAGAQQSEGDLGRIDLDRLIPSEAAKVDAQRSHRELDLRCPVVEIEEREIGAAAEAKRGGAQIHFDTRVVVGPQAVARCHGAIGLCRDPVVDAAWLEGNRSVDITEARRAAGRIGALVILILGDRKRRERQGEHGAK